VGRAKGGMADTLLIVGVTLKFNKQHANKFYDSGLWSKPLTILMSHFGYSGSLVGVL
jgi:hypothetical protein